VAVFMAVCLSCSAQSTFRAALCYFVLPCAEKLRGAALTAVPWQKDKAWIHWVQAAVRCYSRQLSGVDRRVSFPVLPVPDFFYVPVFVACFAYPVRQAGPRLGCSRTAL
jgi:hypothetical protein